MIILEIGKENEEFAMSFFKDSMQYVRIMKINKFNGSSELIQVCIMVSALTAGSIVRLVRELNKREQYMKILGQGGELKPEEITEEYIKEHTDDCCEPVDEQE